MGGAGGASPCSGHINCSQAERNVEGGCGRRCDSHVHSSEVGEIGE